MGYDLDSIIGPVLFTLSYIVGPFLAVVGSFFAYSISLDIKCPLPLKALGWVAGLPFAVFVATLLLPLLLPHFVDRIYEFVGLVLLAGYGWAMAWLGVAHIARREPSNRNPSASRRPKKLDATETSRRTPPKAARSRLEW